MTNQKSRRSNRLIISLGILFSLSLIIVSVPLSAQSGNAALDLQNAFRQISTDVLPVVVQVNTVNVIERKTVNPFEFFFRFPNSPRQPESPQTQSFRQKGLGSGVIVERREDHVYILTNNHVVDGADEIEVNLSDGRKFTATLVGGDPLRDLALISIDTKDNLPIAKLGNSDDVWVGDWVLAIGNPLGFESTVTAGIISAKGRNAEGQNFTDYLQTDASINPGNSGGALVNLNGEVIGINSFIASTSGGNIGLGFAIPINNARRAIDDFIEKGSVEYAWLGVNMGDLNKILSEELDLTGKSGAFIYNVYGESPAMKSDIRPGDLITSLAGRTIENSNDLSRTVSSLLPDQSVPVTLIRDGNTMNLNIQLAVRTIERDGLNVNVWPGFSAVPVTAELRDQMRIPRTAGNVLIGGVVEGSPASALGLRSGDVIKAINRRNVRNLQHFYELINAENRIEIKITRQGNDLEFILNK
ncbi:MAG: Do family serine endopeptidase [Spirochaetaceae bacterium]|nr:Do family serine endopeptidase [Spirochaetaceae bacterium]